MDTKLAEAIELLKNAVKYSDVKNQKHIDLSIINAKFKKDYQVALMITRQAVTKGEITDDELKQKLGLV